MKVQILNPIYRERGNNEWYNDNVAWVEPGTYRVIRKLERERYLINIAPLSAKRVLTIVNNQQGEII